MEIVINASPLIFLSKINRLYLLNKLFKTIYIPMAVLCEIKVDQNIELESKIKALDYVSFEVTNRTAVNSLLVQRFINPQTLKMQLFNQHISS